MTNHTPAPHPHDTDADDEYDAFGNRTIVRRLNGSHVTIDEYRNGSHVGGWQMHEDDAAPFITAETGVDGEQIVADALAGNTIELARPDAHRADLIAWNTYRAACEAENLDAHTFHMWTVHGRPTGPLG